MFGEYKWKIPVKWFTDSESTNQVEKKFLRIKIKELKDRLVEEYVSSYAWLPTEHIWVDILTKRFVFMMN